MKHKYILLAILISNLAFTQVLISDKAETNPVPHGSAILEIRSNNKGLMLPKANPALITNAPEGLLFYNTVSNKLNFWDTTKWSKNLEATDVAGLIPETINQVGKNTSKTNITTFSSSTFNYDDPTTGWTSLNTKVSLTPKKTINTITVNLDGMAQLNNFSYAEVYSFAVGIFVDNKLKIVRKFEARENGSCSWKKFDLSGIFKNLPPKANNGSYNVEVYARNLEKSSSNSRTITYGGPVPNSGDSNCPNINEDMAQINLAVQITE